MKCKFVFNTKETCQNDLIIGKNFCKPHLYYEGKLDINNFKWCDIHKMKPLIYNEEKILHCKLCDKKSLIKLCKGKSQKEEPCTFKALEGDEYCKLHQSYKKWTILNDKGKIICNNWIRGCWNEIDNTYVRCLDCRQDERTREKKLRNKKEETAKIFNSNNSKEKMCKDCNKTVIQLFNKCCYECYKVKLSSNRNRNERDRYVVKLYECKKGALNRKYSWNLEDDYAIGLMKNQCYYCFDNNIINGIDRVDNNRGYEKDNCVTCCFQCNNMKGIKNKDEFFSICEHIATYQKLYNGKLNNKLFIASTSSDYTKYKYYSKKRGIIFNLDKTYFDKLLKDKCNYCGLDKSNGVDRINSSKSYSIDNCVSCCRTCNFMKLDFSQDQFIEKCLAITFKREGIYYKSENLDSEKDKLIKMFKNIEFVTETNNDEFIYKNSDDFYKKMIWNGNITDLKKIKPKLIFAETDELLDIWLHYRNKISSIPFQKSMRFVGRVIQILVKDETTNKYLGIMSLNSDLLHLEDRDDYIKWTNEQRVLNKKINYLMNLSTCVPLQPFGFNFNGGKLLSKLAFSKEIADYYYAKYNQKILGITTTGFHGKSVQYDRLKEFKFVGFTKGYSTYKIPAELVEQCRIYLMSKSINYSHKLHILNKTIQDLGLDKNDYMIDNPKGIYFGFCHPKAQDFLCEKIQDLKDFQLKNTNEIFNEWLDRWGENRYNNLIKNNNFKLEIEMKIPIEKPIKKEENKNLDYKKIYKEKKDYFKKYYNEKKEAINKNKIIPNDKIIMPTNFTLYEEKGKYYLQYTKSSKEDRKSAKKIVRTNNLKNELDELIDILKNKYPNIVIADTKIINPQLFKLPEIEIEEEIPEIIIQDKKKPIMPVNFSICRVKDIDYIQFSKRIETTLYQYKTKINSYNIQSELNKFIDYLKTTYNLTIEEGKVENKDNWKTTNKIKKSLTV